MERCGEAVDCVASLVDFAPLDRRMGAKGVADDFAQRLRAVYDGQAGDLRVEPALKLSSASAGMRARFRGAPGNDRHIAFRKQTACLSLPLTR
jgi:hypothetical protein